MNFHKILFSLGVATGEITAVALFWKQPLIIIFISITLAFLKHRVYPLEKEFVLFILGAILGSAGETIAVLGGAWSYTEAQLIFIPIWLPFLWGLAGITGITLYEGFKLK